jgi:transposase
MTATPVNKEAIRVLVIQHGQREAARIAGLNENTVRSWARRYKWSTPNSASKVQPNGHSPLTAHLESEMQRKERETRLGLATYAEKQSKHLATKGKLKDSGHFKNVTSGAGILHKWDAKEQNQGNVVVNVAILGVDPSEVSVKGEVVSEADCLGYDGA